MRPPDHQINQIVEQEQSLQAMEAQAAGAMWYYTRIMCQLALPASKFEDNEFSRDSGRFHLVVQAPRKFGIPYGIYPRGILNWMVTEIIHPKGPRRPDRIIILGKTLREFISHATGAQSSSGGRTGNIGSFKRQLNSLLSSRIYFWEGEEDLSSVDHQSFEIAPRGHLFWEKKENEETSLFDSWLKVGEEFWNDCLEHKVPVDVRIIRELWPNCLAFDAYVWLTYKAYVRQRHGQWSTEISWPGLKFQFGSQYKEMKKFAEKFRGALTRVRRYYHGFDWQEREGKSITFVFRRPSILAYPSVPMNRYGAKLDQAGLVLQLPQASTHK